MRGKEASNYSVTGRDKDASNYSVTGRGKEASNYSVTGSMMSSKSIVSSVYKMHAFFTEKKVTIFKLSSGETFLVKVYMTINAKML